MNETWKPVLGYEDCYEISNFGVVRSITRYNPKSKRWYESRIMKTRLDKDGYVVVGLTKDGKMKMNKVHRLVISTFTNEDLDLQVNHIDGNKQNNNLDNLEWCTCSMNIKHSYDTGLRQPIDHPWKKPVLQIDKSGNVVNSFKSCSEAYRKTGIRHIREARLGKQKTAGGYYWRNG